MPLAIGETKEVWGSGSKPYVLKNCDGTVWSCTCPSWRNKSGGVMRTCKHLLAENGKVFEDARLAGVVQGKIVQTVVSAPKPGFKTRILIRFRNDDGTFQTLGSPLFESPRDLWDDERLDELVVDGDDKTGFCISCDAEGTKDPKTGVHTIVWLMFEPNVHGWVQDLHRVWKRRMGFELPAVDKWAWTDLEKELAGCACEQGSTCDVSHNPASCACVQCSTAEAESPEDIIAQVMGTKPLLRPAEPQGNPVPLKEGGIAPSAVTKERFAEAYANTPHAQWRHLLCPTGDGAPQSLENFWGSFRSAVDNEEEPGWVEQVMEVLGLRCTTPHIEMDKSKRLNKHGGFLPFTEQEKAVVVAREEAKKGRKLRQDEKTDLFGPDLLLANQFEDCEDMDPAGWLESEKLDGLRGLFNGERFISRQGNVFAAPDFFLVSIPQVPLDGELWTGRGKAEFQAAMSIVRSGNGGEAWKRVKFVVFDAPAHPGTFEERLTYLRSLTLPDHVIVHPHQICDGRDGLMRRLQETAQAGGEGRMLRRPGSEYEGRRSSSLLKVKPFQDAEAEVIAHVAGKGRHKGKLGGLTMKTSDGRVFNVGTGLTDAERRSPPPVGCIVTYRFAGCTADGLPKCASFLRVRLPE